MVTISPETRALATQESVLPMGLPTLLGTFGPEDDQRALVRYPDGHIDTLSPGDKTRLGRVSAVAASVVHIAIGARQHVLEMPKDKPAQATLRPRARPTTRALAARAQTAAV